MIKAKVFKSGNSQATRLPKEFRLKVNSVKINKIGNLLVLIPEDDPWANFIDGIREAAAFPVVNDSGLALKEIDMK